MMDCMTPDEIRTAADGLADTLASIESGTLDATDAQRAYLTGSLHALRSVLGEEEPRFAN
jgi:hypothetical protein